VPPVIKEHRRNSRSSRRASLPLPRKDITYFAVSTNPLIEIRKIRLGKAASLRTLGLNPYPSRSRRTHYAQAILEEFTRLEGTSVTVAGRLMSWRKQGALAFGHVQDQSGRIQLFLRRQLVQPTDAAAGTLGYSDLKDRKSTRLNSSHH
jgi:lysyl-tRNA synthetase class II